MNLGEISRGKNAQGPSKLGPRVLFLKEGKNPPQKGEKLASGKNHVEVLALGLTHLLGPKWELE